MKERPRLYIDAVIFGFSFKIVLLIPVYIVKMVLLYIGIQCTSLHEFYVDNFVTKYVVIAGDHLTNFDSHYLIFQIREFHKQEHL